jgi:hypothetical protein
LNRTGWIFAAAISVVGVVGGAGAVTATTADDAPLTGEARDRAVPAALAHVGGGVVTDTEPGDDGAAYGVEIRKPDGTEVEVNLDRAYRVTGTEADDDAAETDDHDDADNDADDVNDNDGPDDPDDDPGESTSNPTTGRGSPGPR